MSRKPSPEKLAQMEKDRQDELVRNLAERIEFLKGLPKRLKDASTIAVKLNVSAYTTLDDFGPVVTFQYDDAADNIFIDSKITYNSEMWEMDHLESQLQSLKLRVDARAAMMELAQSTYNKLNTEEKTALRTYIKYLT